VPQRALTTARIDLHPLADEHLDHEVELDAIPEVHRHLGQRPRTRAETSQEHVRRLARAEPVDGLGVWAGFVRADTGDGAVSFLGLWMLQPPDGPDQVFVPGEADLGYRLLPRWWRQGFGTEGSRALMSHGFQALGLTRVFAQTATENAPSRALVSSLGMTFVRDVGEGGREVEYEMTRAAWLAGGGQQVAPGSQGSP
jgi:RimJ/RimL family protein N-acetyltransferase